MNRDDFPIFNINKDLIYFDNGATTLKPITVINKEIEYLSCYTANSHRGDYNNSFRVDDEIDNTRNLIKEFINSKTGTALYNASSKLWCAGPSYIVELYNNEKARGDTMTAQV